MEKPLREFKPRFFTLLLKPLYPIWTILRIKEHKVQDSGKKGQGKKSKLQVKGIGQTSIMKFFSDSKLVIDTTKKGTFELRAIKSIDLTIIEALLGVAENGAVWINWSDS